MKTTTLSSMLCLALLVSAPAFAAGTCKKDGAEVKTAGKNAKAQQSDCTKKGGTWEAAEERTESSDQKEEKSSGGGGGW